MSDKPATEKDYVDLGSCTGCPSASDLKRCMNCRKAVEDSLTRVAGRKLRRLRRNPECSASKCAAFLERVKDKALRFHLASMAWWRFSSEGGGESAEAIRRLMVGSAIEKPAFGLAYMHEVLRLLSPLTQEQLTAWFGHDNLHQIASFYGGVSFSGDGVNCSKCKLYDLGCTVHNVIGADECPLWKDKYVQDVAKAISKSGEWKNPCNGVKDRT